MSMIWTPREQRTGNIALSGGSAATSGSAGLPAGFRVNTDGTIDKREDGTYTQLSASTDWIIPNAAANGVYQVRVTSVTSTGGTDSGFNTVEAATEDTWIALTANREWSCESIGTGGADSVGYDFDIQIRYGSGPVLATGSYSAISEGF